MSDLAKAAALHREVPDRQGGLRGECWQCGYEWPCPVAQLLEKIEELRGENEQLAREVAYMNGRWIAEIPIQRVTKEFAERFWPELDGD